MPACPECGENTERLGTHKGSATCLKTQLQTLKEQQETKELSQEPELNTTLIRELLSELTAFRQLAEKQQKTIETLLASQKQLEEQVVSLKQVNTVTPRNTPSHNQQTTETREVTISGFPKLDQGQEKLIETIQMTLELEKNLGYHNLPKDSISQVYQKPKTNTIILQFKEGKEGLKQTLLEATKKHFKETKEPLMYDESKIFFNPTVTKSLSSSKKQKS
eukprot:Lithocolla_globosa_v1_NODE_846_length_3194_cov_50.626633.p2 type:complete len:220 gc:universal NODE_846_length_3194_cov_50.626633:3000-2341(-)